MKRLKWVFASLALAIFISGCTTVEETGRKQLRLVSPSQEMQLGLGSFEELKKQTPISRDPQANAMLQRVGKRIAAVADLEGAQWEFVLFEDKTPNAFCLPGGKVGVHTGILPLTKTDAGLATVIGHEVAHASLHHGAERMSRAMAMQLGGQLVGAAASAADPRLQSALALAYGAGAKVGVELPHSRAQELEADRVGMRYMARAGYDPAEAIRFWERFAAQDAKGGSSMPGFLSTHPVDKVRVRELQRWLPEAKAQYRGR
jgi:metalloendopeptidase OMA1, mitochondrial